MVVYLKKRDGTILESYIDLEDFDKVKQHKYKWYAIWMKNTKSYYARSTLYIGIINGEPKYDAVYLHRFIIDVDSSIKVDHKNHNTLDNRKENLRLTTNDKNTKNRESKNSNNSSGYRNVSLDKKSNEWMVQLIVDGKNSCLKRFPYEQLHEAGKYAEEKRKDLYGEFAGVS